MPTSTVFLNEDVTKLLYQKTVVILGDSIQRGIYKDLVALLQGSKYLSRRDLRAKGERSFMNDVLLEGGEMHNGIHYREVREYKTDNHSVRFYFITRIYNNYWKEIILPDLQGAVPDVIIMNSCLWDISRYGQQGMETYKRNIETTFSKLKSILPMETLIMWNTALPVAEKIKGCFQLPGLQEKNKTMGPDILLGNSYAKNLAERYDIHVVDLYNFFSSEMHRQVEDGVHWNSSAHREITKMILKPIAVSWRLGYQSESDDQTLYQSESDDQTLYQIESYDRYWDESLCEQRKKRRQQKGRGKSKVKRKRRKEKRKRRKEWAAHFVVWLNNF